MQPIASNPATWLDTLWEAIWDWEDSEPDPDRVDDVKTAMAWLAERLELEPTASGYVSLAHEDEDEDCKRNGHRDTGRGVCADCGGFL